MPLISFSGETYEGPFWKQILESHKRQTCRTPRKRPIEKGDILYLYWKCRVPKAKKPIHFIGEAVCTNVEHLRYREFAHDEAFARRDGFHDSKELQEWFGDPEIWGHTEYDVISFLLKCVKCEHFHSTVHLCSYAFCIRCGLGGDLTHLSCEKHQEMKKRMMKIMRVRS